MYFLYSPPPKLQTDNYNLLLYILICQLTSHRMRGRRFNEVNMSQETMIEMSDLVLNCELGHLTRIPSNNVTCVCVCF